MSEAHDQIMEELASIKSGLGRIEGQIAKGATLFEVFDDGLESFRQKKVAHLRQMRAREMCHIRFSSDPALGFPHRKILECLARHYDDSRQQFEDVQFTKIVSEARVSKGRAKRYLAMLESRGHVRRRDTGYRVFYRITTAASHRIRENF